jgi:hypothetical protein
MFSAPGTSLWQVGGGICYAGDLVNPADQSPTFCGRMHDTWRSPLLLDGLTHLWTWPLIDLPD